MNEWFACFEFYDEDGNSILKGSIVKSYDSSMRGSDVLKALEDEVCEYHGKSHESLHFKAFNRV